MLIAVVNHSTLVSDSEAYDMTLAVNHQLRHDVAPAWDRMPPHVIYLAAEPRPVPGSTVLGIFDDAGQPGYLGWHTETAGDIAYGRIFAKPVLDNGGGVLTGEISVSSVLSHEAVEAFGDRACQMWADDYNGTGYAFEWADAVEGDSYPVTLSAGQTTVTATVSDFQLPAWFDPMPAPGAWFDYLGLTSAPFQIRPTGYMVLIKEGQVTQQFGERYPEWRKATKETALARTSRRLTEAPRIYG